MTVNAETIANSLQCDNPRCQCHRQQGDGWLVHCPAHDDREPSLSVTIKDGKILVHCHAGCSQQAVIEVLTQKGLWQSKPKTETKPKKGKPVIEAIYDYHNQDGNLVFQVVRMKPKTFRQRRPDGKGGWLWNLDGVKRVPFRLHELIAAETVYVVEGEKDVEALRAWGLTATCNPGGASKWDKDFEQYFPDKQVVIIPDNDHVGRKHAKNVAESLHGTAAIIKILDLPGLPEKGDVSDWINAGGTKDVLLSMVEETSPREFVDKTTLDGEDARYLTKDGALCYQKQTTQGPVLVPLCNFDARIIEEVIRDDGAETQTLFKIQGTLQDGKPLATIEVPAGQFPNMGWVTNVWGFNAVVYPGTTMKDHARAAIQLLSKDAIKRRVYEHTGWTNVNGLWVYLHCNGAIDKNGPVPNIEVALNGSLSAFSLPTPPEEEELSRVITKTLDIRHLAPPSVSFPLLGATFLAPLGAVLVIDFSVFLAGITGSQKTECAAISQCHYGAGFSSRNLPANWSSTANSLEKIAFLAKDAVLVIDDFCPTGTSHDVKRFHKDADRVLRGVGNQAGRQRMKADGGLRPTYRPRGLVISTGEDIPQGHSLRSRMVLIEVKKGDVNLNRLTTAQQNGSQGIYAKAMSGYVQWLAMHMEALQNSLKTRHAELLASFRQALTGTHGVHDRIPDNLAHLQLGFETFIRFAIEKGALNQAEATQYQRTCQDVLLSVGKAQGSHLVDEDPVRQFLSLLSALLVNGKAHLADKEDQEEPAEPELWGWRKKIIGTGDYSREEWQPQGVRVGWVKHDDVYLEPDAVFAAVQSLAREQDSILPIKKTTLWKRLAEQRVLASTEFKRQRNTVRVAIDGVRWPVLHLKVAMLRQIEGDSSVGQEIDQVVQPSPPNDPKIQRPCGPGSEGPVRPTYDERELGDKVIGSRVKCSTCVHFNHSPINPETGYGTCQIPEQSKRGGSIFPLKQHQCSVFQPKDAYLTEETLGDTYSQTDPTDPTVPSELNDAAFKRDTFQNGAGNGGPVV